MTRDLNFQRVFVCPRANNNKLMIAWTAIYAGMLDIINTVKLRACQYLRACILRVYDDNQRMRLPEEKSSAKSTASVSGPHTKTAERISKNSVLRQFLVTPQ